MEQQSKLVPRVGYFHFDGQDIFTAYSVILLLGHVPASKIQRPSDGLRTNESTLGNADPVPLIELRLLGRGRR